MIEETAKFCSVFRCFCAGILHQTANWTDRMICQRVPKWGYSVPVFRSVAGNSVASLSIFIPHFEEAIFICWYVSVYWVILHLPPFLPPSSSCFRPEMVQEGMDSVPESKWNCKFFCKKELFICLILHSLLTLWRNNTLVFILRFPAKPKRTSSLWSFGLTKTLVSPSV